MEQDFVNGSPLQLALREMQTALTSRNSRLGMMLAVVLLSVSGPFGTFEQFSYGPRFVYWAVVVLTTYVAGQGATTLAIQWLRPRIGQKWPRLVVGSLAGALPVTLILVIINTIAFGRFQPDDIVKLWLYATIVTVIVVLVLTALGDALRGQTGTAAAPPEGQPAVNSPAVDPAAPILERVPLPQRGRLLALVVEDHYVDIMTDKGKTLVLMRLADAMRETGDIPGLQIHRSHWVATGAVVKVHRTDGKLTLELSNGLRLPVSRGFMPAVKAAGLVA